LRLLSATGGAAAAGAPSSWLELQATVIARSNVHEISLLRMSLSSYLSSLA
jgi:hypothetical protein